MSGFSSLTGFETGNDGAPQSDDRRIGRIARAGDGIGEAFGDDAVLHQANLVAEQHRFLDIVGHEHDGRAEALPQSDELALQAPPRHRVQRGERLVEQQQLGFGDEGTGKARAARHATRKLIGPGTGEVVKADHVEDFDDALGDFGLRHAAFQREADIARDAEPRHQARLLEYVADARVAGAARDRATRRRFEARKQAQGCCFAAARRADEHGEAARRQGEVEIAQRRDVAILQPIGF